MTTNRINNVKKMFQLVDFFNLLTERRCRKQLLIGIIWLNNIKKLTRN